MSTAGAAIDRRIIGLAFPAVLTIAADPLYDLTDTAILGHVGSNALGGAALATTLLANGYAVFIFLLYGTTSTVARLRGAGRERDAAHHSVQAMWVAFAVGSLVAALLVPAAPLLVDWAGGRGAVADAALTYFRISLLGFPAFFLVMAGAGARRGVQDLRTPLLITVVAVAANLAAEVVLIIGLGFGVGASAGSTVAAKWCAAAAYVVLIGRDAKRRGVPRSPDRAAVRAVSSAGIPLLVRTIALRAALTVAITVAGRIGDTDLAAYAIAFGVSSTLAYLCEGLEVAAHTLIGTALGTSDDAAAVETGRRVIRMGFLLGVVNLLIVALAARWLPALFSPDPAVRATATTSLWWVAAMQPIATVSFALDGVLIGANDLRYLAFAMPVATAAFSALAVGALAADAGLWALWAALIVFMAVRAVLLGHRFRTRRWLQATISGSSPRPSS